MSKKIDQKIVGFQVKSKEEQERETESNIVQMHEKVSRPEALDGATYKIKTPLSDHALYVTINDIILNPGTDHELRRPFEIFINSKNMDHFQWIVALTRVVSAVFRKGGDCTFLVEELKAVFDPQGGYFKSGGRFMPSLVAEIGWVIEDHLQNIGLLEMPSLTDHQKQILDEKKEQYAQRTGDDGAGGEFPATASLCRKCSVKAAILMDGCLTCLNCGDSKCG
ncbi:NrdJb [Mangrovimicrobium sediminis]|uniref:ribonucleoside-diphosphate reductase n=1 Tax=Mangrovimicrobium sediminis TaxID=2562682 RepID=A0A4Z0LWV6_9GAMM|nr:NrdJb [Haliea sp. SAOS-164]TGD71769.1 NrdJb [Haliea sp. SAOS-164]